MASEDSASSPVLDSLSPAAVPCADPSPPLSLTAEPESDPGCLLPQLVHRDAVSNVIKSIKITVVFLTNVKPPQYQKTVYGFTSDKNRRFASTV